MVVCAYMEATLLRALASSNTICDCRSGAWALHYSSPVSSPWCFPSCKILVRVGPGYHDLVLMPAMSAVEDARWILSRVLVHLTVFSFPKHDSKYDCKSLCDLSVCARFHWLRMSPKLLQWRIHPPLPCLRVWMTAPPSEGLDLPLSCVAFCKLPLDTQYC